MDYHGSKIIISELLYYFLFACYSTKFPRHYQEGAFHSRQEAINVNENTRSRDFWQKGDTRQKKTRKGGMKERSGSNAHQTGPGEGVQLRKRKMVGGQVFHSSSTTTKVLPCVARIFGVRLRSGHLNLYLLNRPSYSSPSVFLLLLPSTLTSCPFFTLSLSPPLPRFVPLQRPSRSPLPLLSSSFLSIELWRVYETWQLRMFQKKMVERKEAKKKVC